MTCRPVSSHFLGQKSEAGKNPDEFGFISKHTSTSSVIL